MTKKQDKNNLSLLILSHDRKKGLKNLLRNILQQKINNLKLELIIINNYPKHYLKKTFFTPLGRILNKFEDVKIINSNYNWGCNIRHQIATLAKNDICLFLDDDIVLLDEDYIKDMYEAFLNIGEYDILSSWGKLWTEWNDNYFAKVDLNFKQKQITEITEFDAAGTGICMLNKEMLIKKDLLKMLPEAPEAYDTPFSQLAYLALGSHSYYFPAYERMCFHNQKTKKAIYRQNNFFENMFRSYKICWQRGYEPVIARIKKEANWQNSPEIKAIQLLTSTKYDW